jgi:hypothetical protein
LQAYLFASACAYYLAAWCAWILGLRVTCGWVSPCVCCVRAQCACVGAHAMGLHLPRSATRIKVWSRCHDTHAGAHLRIVFPLGDAHIDMRMRMSCARGDGARPITESGTRCRGSSTARSSTVAARPSSCGLSAATCGTFRATRALPDAVFFFAGCFPAPFSEPSFGLAAGFVATRLCVSALAIS